MSDVDYDSAIALVGMSGRFPGAASVQGLWDNLIRGELGLRELTDEELMAAGVPPAQLADPSYVRTSGSITDYDMFDAGMFGFGRREAEIMDPQHRLFLECCYEALEHSGYPPMRMPGRVGVFGGCGFPDYTWNVAGAAMAEAGGMLLLAIGTERDSLTSLASYKMNLRGPSVTVQTFCSTSLVAVHLGAQALLNFECEVALAGGAFIPLPQGTGYAFEDGSIYAPDGKVRAFDAGARGSVAGSGVSVVALKRLSDAIADGDYIWSVILGSANNNDGSACAGYTAPGVDGQSAVIADAISFAGVKPETIGYLECHGTGTLLGDSIELAAMAQVFPDRVSQPGQADQRVVLGSLKASIGHMDRAAGTSSLIRAALALQNGVLPATPNYKTPNPALASARRKFTVLTETRPWPGGAEPRRAGVSAFGLGGSNVHVVLEEPPAAGPAIDRPGPHLLVVSGRDTAAADQAAADLRAHLEQHRDLVVADVAFTLQHSRSYYPVRRAVVCDDLPGAVRALDDPESWLTGEAWQRDPQVDLVLPDPAQADPAWCTAVTVAAQRIAGAQNGSGHDVELLEADLATAAAAVGAALRAAGVKVGRVRAAVAAGASETEPATDVTAGPATELAARLAGQLGAESDKPGVLELVLGVNDDAGTTGPAEQWLARALARCWLAGAEPNWEVLHPGRPRRVPLPTYPFQRRRYWVDGVVSTAGTAPAPAAGRTDDLDRWTYVPTWTGGPAQLASPAAAARDAGPWLVLAADSRGEAVAGQLRDLGAEVTIVRPGEEFGSDAGGGFRLQPESAADFGRLLNSLPKAPRTVVHAFALKAQGPAAPGFASWTQARKVGFGPATALVSAYSRHAAEVEVNLIAVTEGAVSVSGTSPANPGQAMLAGLLPTLAQENPGWTARHVDVAAIRAGLAPAAADRAIAAAGAAIIAEALEVFTGPVAVRGTTRWRRSFARLPLPASAGAGPLASGSVVLITGGLGHVGLILARHLGVVCGCTVLLTSRTALPPRHHWEAAAAGHDRAARHVKTLLELERLGATVVPVTADASNVEQMRAVVAVADERFGRLDLVVHAAGISDPSGFGPAHLVTEAGADQHFSAKVTGFEVLCEVLAGRDVPGITLSSLSAVLGGISLGPYAASNAALDAAVATARESGARWITVDWDTWGQPDPADAAGPALPAGEFDMTVGQAAQVFERAVAAVDQAGHVVISTGSLQARFDQWIVRRGLVEQASEDAERDPRPELSTPYVEPADGTPARLAGIWAQVLRLERVGADDDFFRLGGTSVLAIELIARIRREFKVSVPTSAVMGFPTVRNLAGQLDEMLAEQAVDASAAAAHAS